MSRDKLKPYFNYLIVSAVSALALICILTASVFIPRNAVKINMYTSAGELCEKSVFFTLWKGVQSSRIDRYADSILLNIAYHFDSDDPVRSVMLSEYYYSPYENENTNLFDSIREGFPANQQYLRYWHGSAAYVRFMHLFTDIHGIYATNAVMLIILTVSLIFLLIWHKLYAGAIGTVISLAAVGAWFVPYSLEYTPTFMIMLIMSIAAVLLSFSEKWNILTGAFQVCGILTAFLDFLTTETLTLLFPLLLSLYIRRTRETKENITFAVRNTVLWGIGYVGMWVFKWILAAAILGEDVMPYITDHITERLGGEVGGQAPSVFGALWNNISCLYPAAFGGIGLIAAIVIALGISYVCFVYRRSGINTKLILIYAAAGIIPYIRFAVLTNHSYLHHFFTYRAQAATLLAVCLIIYEIVGGRANGTKKRKHA